MINQKKINSLLLLLILVVPILISPNHYQVDGEIEDILESTDNLLIDPISNEIDSSTATKQSVVDYNTVYQGETVKTEILFTKNTFNPDQVLITCDEPNDIIKYTWEHYGYLYEDDEDFFEISYEWGSPDDFQRFVVDFRIYCGSSGTLSWRDIRAYAANTGYEVTVDQDGDLSVTNDMLDNEGFLHLALDIKGTADTVYLYFYYIDTNGYTTLESESETGSIGDTKILIFEADMLIFIRDTITNNIRSSYRYSSATTITHKVIIPSTPHAEEIRTYTDLEFSSINPSTTVTRVSDYWKIANPTEINYSVLFASICSNRLAIADFSTDYLTDVGFESTQYLNDWSINYGTFDLDTQTVFEGSYSLSIETSNADYFNASDDCDFEEDDDEFDIKLNSLPTLDRIEADGEWKLRLYTGGAGSNYGARRDNLDIDTNQFNLFSTEIRMIGGVKADRVKITLHFDDASTQDFIELIASGTMEEFEFTITADKTIEMIDIYYGDSVWDIGGGDRIYVSFIKILETGAELSLSLPENDYYLSYSTFIESGSVTLTTDDRTLVNDGSITDRWINNFVFTHTDTVTFTILFDDLDLTNFLDNFGIFQTSTTIETLEPSKYLISSTLIAWGYKNPAIPYADLEFELWDRPDQTLEESYSTTTDEYGVATWTLERGLEQKEYELRAYSTDSYFSGSPDWVDTEEKTESLTEWLAITESVITLSSSNVKVGDYAINNTKTSGTANFLNPRYDNVGTIDFSNVDYFFFWVYRDSPNAMITFGVSFYTTGGGYYSLSVIDQCPDDQTWYFIKVTVADFNAYSSPDASSLIYIYFRMEIDASVGDYLLIDDLKAIHSSKLYFTPSYPHQTDYAETELLDAWDFSEGDLEGMSIHTNYDVVSSSISTENGKFIIEYESAGTATSYVMTKITNLGTALDLSYYDNFIIRAKSNSSATTHTFYLYHTTYGVLSATTGAIEFSDSWEVIQTDVLQSLTLSELYFVCRQQDILANSFKVEVDFLELVHIDSFLEETNDYATDNLHDAWDFEEDIDGWLASSGGLLTLNNNYATLSFASGDEYYTMYTAVDYAVDTYLHVVIKYRADPTSTFQRLQLKFPTSGTTIVTIPMTEDGLWHLMELDIDDGAWTGVGDIVLTLIDTEHGKIDINYISITYLDSMPYSTIQNSVLLESETDDLQYTLYLDHNLIGTFPDLSLIPLIQTVGTHYVQVQPFRTDQAYITQNIYTYYYTIDADAFSVSINSFYLSDEYVNTYFTANYIGSYYVYENDVQIATDSFTTDSTTILTARNMTVGETINHAVKFTYSSETVWFNTTYQNAVSSYFLTEYSHYVDTTNVNIYWNTSIEFEYMTIEQLDTMDFEEGDTENLQLSHTTYNFEVVDGSLIIEGVTTYGFSPTGCEWGEESEPIWEYDFDFTVWTTFMVKIRTNVSDSFSFHLDSYYGSNSNPSMAFNLDSTKGWQIFTYDISDFTRDSDGVMLWGYGSAGAPMKVEIEYMKILTGEVSVFEDGVEKVSDSYDYPVSYAKNTAVGSHYVTVIFECYNYQEIIHSFSYTIFAEESFAISIESFYLTDNYVNTYATSNFDGSYIVYENDINIGSGTLYATGTTISTARDLTAGATISYSIKFVNSSSTIWFNTTYQNIITDYFLTNYALNQTSTEMNLYWNTSLDWDYATYELGDAWDFNEGDKEDVFTYNYDDDFVDDGIYSYDFGLEIEGGAVTGMGFTNVDLTLQDYPHFEIKLKHNQSGYNFRIYGLKYHEDTGKTMSSCSYFEIFGANMIFDTEWATFTFLLTDNIEIGSLWVIFTPNGYPNQNTQDGDFIFVDYIKFLAGQVTVIEDGVEVISDSLDYPVTWTKSVEAGTHYVSIIFECANYQQIIRQFEYTIFADELFTVSLESFYLSDLYVNTFVTSNYDGSYIVYEDSTPIDSGTLHKEGTTIITNRDVTPAASINYTIAFTYLSEVVVFQTYYNNPSSDFFVTSYSIDIDATITVTWDTSKNTIDSLTIIEDGVEKVTDDSGSPTTWTKSTEAGTHHVTLIFEATDYNDILFSFVYTVAAIEDFSVNVQSFYMTDDYVNLYCTSNFDYSYIAYTNGSETGTGNGIATGTYIIIPKLKEAGLWNFTIEFTYTSETVIFMTWYSNLIPPLHPLNDLYREQSQGFYNISVYSNLEFYWIDIYHDDSLIIDDSTATFFSIEKGLRVGWHNITLVYTYNCSTNAEGYPVAEYNVTIAYPFWYETTFFYDVTIRYIEDLIGIAISEINVNDFKTYIDGELVLHGDIDDVEIYSNYSYISNYNIRIKNTVAVHTLIVKDLLGTTILSTTIDISLFTSKIIELPIYLLGMINLDTATHKIGVKYQPWTDSPWKLSPELPQGAFIKFWFCGGTYGLRLYNATIYYDAAGNPYKEWHEYTDLPPGILPYTIIIPLTLDIIGPDPIEEKVNITMYVAIAILVLATVFIIVTWRIRKRKKS